jgi:hypothetical protein
VFTRNSGNALEQSCLSADSHVSQHPYESLWSVASLLSESTRHRRCFPRDALTTNLVISRKSANKNSAARSNHFRTCFLFRRKTETSPVFLAIRWKTRVSGMETPTSSEERVATVIPISCRVWCELLRQSRSSEGQAPWRIRLDACAATFEEIHLSQCYADGELRTSRLNRRRQAVKIMRTNFRIQWLLPLRIKLP